jgi:hypothetical protein
LRNVLIQFPTLEEQTRQPPFSKYWFATKNGLAYSYQSETTDRCKRAPIQSEIVDTAILLT